MAKAEVEVYDPIASPPSVEQLGELAAKYDGPLRDLALHREPLFRELDLDGADDDTLLAALAANPTLLRLPIGVAGDKAIIARPGEVVLAVLTPQVPEGTDERAMMRLGMSGKLPEMDTSKPLDIPARYSRD